MNQLLKKAQVVAFMSLSVFQTIAIATEEVTFNPPSSGTVVKWEGTKNGKSFQEEHLIGENSGLLARWKSNGKNYERYGLISWGTPDTFDTSKIDPMWPLKVGNSASYTRSKGKRKWNDSMKVIGIESITTKIGRFDTYILQLDTERQNKKWSAIFKAWYAPKIGWAIKREYKDSKGNSSISEAVEIKAP